MPKGPEFSPHDEMMAGFEEDHPFNQPQEGDVLTDDEAIHESLIADAGDDGEFHFGPDEQDQEAAEAEAAGASLLNGGHYASGANGTEASGNGLFADLDDLDLDRLVPEPATEPEPRLGVAVDAEGNEFEVIEEPADPAPDRKGDIVDAVIVEDKEPAAEPAPDSAPAQETGTPSLDVGSLSDAQVRAHAAVAGLTPVVGETMDGLRARLADVVGTTGTQPEAPAEVTVPQDLLDRSAAARERAEAAAEASEPAPAPEPDTAPEKDEAAPEDPIRDRVAAMSDRQVRIKAMQAELPVPADAPIEAIRTAVLRHETASNEVAAMSDRLVRIRSMQAELRTPADATIDEVRRGLVDHMATGVQVEDFAPTPPKAPVETNTDQPAPEATATAPDESDPVADGKESAASRAEAGDGEIDNLYVNDAEELGEAPTPPADEIDPTGLETEPAVEIIIPESADVNPNGRELEDALRSPAVVGQMAQNLGIGRLNPDGTEKSYEEIQAEIVARVQAEGYTDGTYSFEAYTPKVDIATQLRERLDDDSLDAESRAQLERLLALAETEPGLAEVVSEALSSFESRSTRAIDEANEQSLRNSIARAATIATTALYSRELNDPKLTNRKRAEAADTSSLDEGMQDYNAVRAKVLAAMNGVLTGEVESEPAQADATTDIETGTETGRVSLRERWNKLKLRASMGAVEGVRKAVQPFAEFQNRRFQKEMERRINETPEQTSNRIWRNRLVGGVAAAGAVALYYSDERFGGGVARQGVEIVTGGIIEDPFSGGGGRSGVAEATVDAADVFPEAAEAAEAADAADAADVASSAPEGPGVDAAEAGTSPTTAPEATDTTVDTPDTTSEGADTAAGEGGGSETAGDAELDADDSGETAVGDDTESTSESADETAETTDTGGETGADEASETADETEQEADTTSEADTTTENEEPSNERIELAEDFNVDSLEIGSLDAGDTVSGEYRTWAENELGLTGEALDDFTGRAGAMVTNKNPGFDFTQMLPDVDYSDQFDQLTKDELQGILDDVTGYEAPAETVVEAAEGATEGAVDAADTTTEAPADTADTTTETTPDTTETAEQVAFEDTIEAGDGVTDTIRDYVNSEYDVNLSADQLGEVWGDIRSNHAPTEITTWFPGSAEGSEWGVFYPSTGEGGLSEAGKAELDEILKRLGMLKAEGSS